MSDPSPWIAAVRSSHDQFAELTGPLAVEQVTRPSYDDGWSIADVASHLGSQAQIFGLLLDAGLSGESPPGMEQFAPIWDEWNAMAPDDQVGRSIEAGATLVARIEALPPAERDAFSVEMFGSTADLSRLLGARLGELAVHTWDIGVALDPGATVLPEAVGLLVDQLSMVAGRAEPAEGADPITLDTTDPSRRFTVTLAPAVLLDPIDAADTPADVTLPAEALVRLIYGRLGPDHTPDGVVDSGVLGQLRSVFVGF